MHFLSGKKRTNRKEQIELLSELYRICEEHKLGPAMLIQVQFAICAAIFDYNPKISAAMKPEYWEKCMPTVEFLLKLISDNEDITIGDHISEEQETLEESPYKVHSYFFL
jgi:translation initiation factor 3 subunit C